MTAQYPRPRARLHAWLGGALCALALAWPATASADEPVASFVSNQAPTHGNGSPPSFLLGAALSITGGLVGVGGLIAMYGDGLCSFDCDEDAPHPGAIAVAAVGAGMALVGLLVVLPLQARARRRWLRERGLRFSSRPGGGALRFEGRF